MGDPHKLSQKDARKILSLLDHPLMPNKRLKDAVKEFKGVMGLKVKTIKAALAREP